MTKWEYCSITNLSEPAQPEEIEQLKASGFAGTFKDVGDETVATLILLTFFKPSPDGTEANHEQKTIQNASSMVAQLGLEGWEMVSYAQLHKPMGAEVLYFKRPLADDSP